MAAVEMSINLGKIPKLTAHSVASTGSILMQFLLYMVDMGVYYLNISITKVDIPSFML